MGEKSTPIKKREDNTILKYERGVFYSVLWPDWLHAAYNGEWAELRDNLKDVGAYPHFVVGGDPDDTDEIGEGVVHVHYFETPDGQSYYVEVQDNGLEVWSALVAKTEFPRFHVDIIAPLRQSGVATSLHRDLSHLALRLDDLRTEVQRLTKAVDGKPKGFD